MLLSRISSSLVPQQTRAHALHAQTLYLGLLLSAVARHGILSLRMTAVGLQPRNMRKKEF